MSVYGLTNGTTMQYSMVQSLNSYAANKEFNNNDSSQKNESENLEELLKKTRRYVKNYNAVLDRTKEVSTLSMKREAQRLVNDTKANAGSFAKLGISITNSGGLEMDEKKEAKQETEKANTYNKAGSYNHFYNSFVEVYI